MLLSPCVLIRSAKYAFVSLLVRLNSSDSGEEHVYIQMVTALVLQLIQCVVQLPSERREEEDEPKKKVRRIDRHYCFLNFIKNI